MDSNMFTILPMSQRFSLKPGETYEGSITVVNPVDATEDFAYKASIVPYGVSGEDYQADLVTDSDHTMVAKWIKLEEPTGCGYSVLEVVKAFEKASGVTVPYVIQPRRPGDIATCYSNPAKAEKELGWKAEKGIDEMCADSYRWQSQNPNGYED